MRYLAILSLIFIGSVLASDVTINVGFYKNDGANNVHVVQVVNNLGQTLDFVNYMVVPIWTGSPTFPSINLNNIASFASGTGTFSVPSASMGAKVFIFVIYTKNGQKDFAFTTATLGSNQLFSRDAEAATPQLNSAVESRRTAYPSNPSVDPYSYALTPTNNEYDIQANGGTLYSVTWSVTGSYGVSASLNAGYPTSYSSIASGVNKRLSYQYVCPGEGVFNITSVVYYKLTVGGTQTSLTSYFPLTCYDGASRAATRPNEKNVNPLVAYSVAGVGVAAGVAAMIAAVVIVRRRVTSATSA